ncbi:hypothetical protein M8818_004673 [Zalaria obscura]|uniref:Uncharacterized protein n=1 Tax=Zalaria obscura TaxID=2024903 RepID=A0ACC3SDN6_9PEZI
MSFSAVFPHTLDVETVIRTSVTMSFLESSSNYTCRRKSYPCVPDNNVDPGIAGIGVIIAFLGTAVFSSSAIIFGYITDSLPKVRTNQVDALVIDSVWTTLSPVVTIFQKALERSPWLMRTGKAPEDETDDKKRWKASC